jgi:peptidoglycan hydrolase-like protein with peptidoglycan-binding domain
MRTALATVFASILLAPSAAAAGDPEIAALQVGLRTHGFYAGTVDGVLSAGTVQAVQRLQRKKGIAVDGVPGPKTRKALGRFGKRAPFGGRVLAAGSRGWDVAALQFALAWHGFPSGVFDGVFGASTDQALRLFQRWSGLGADGLAGPAVIRALRGPLPTCPIRLSPPMPGPYGDLFGPRGNRFHSGIDYPAYRGAPVGAAASGVVTYAGWAAGGWGRLVTVAHASGVQTMYAHLSRVAVRVGQRVATGQRLGRAGASGEASGPHLHFEVRVGGAAVDPLSSLL